MATTPIPQPPGIPLLGNVTTVDPRNITRSIVQLNKIYGEIFKLSLFGKDTYFLCSARLTAELCDETRFCKTINSALNEVRAGVGDGLFTAYNHEHNWGVAHRALAPSFGPLGIAGMYDEMYDIATQLVSKWARTDSEEPINTTDDFTRLALDSIALCAMGKRFNSFYHEELHPFVEAMTSFLSESGARSRKSRLELMVNRSANRKYQADIDLMRRVAQEVIDQRRKTPTDKKDLLNAMLFGKDPKTGERLTDDSIMNNMLTFLIAGHETTSGMLSFTVYYLLKNPEALQKAQQEVDSVVGSGPIKLAHMSKLPYLESCLRESLRLSPPAGALGMTPVPGTKEPVLLGGEYLVPADATLVCFNACAHVDKAAWGPDAEEFRPERMSAENMTKLPGPWKPFGNGMRGCIGRAFAWQEAIIAMALVLQNFNIRMADPSYQLKIKQSLTIKPDEFFIKVSPRSGVDSLTIEKRLHGNSGASHVNGTLDVQKASIAAADARPMTILYGSNSGTCEGLSQKLALNATGRGFVATVKSLDSSIDQFPTNQPVIIITSSYEGQPPDNAVQFTEWLKRTSSSHFTGSQCAVFGCGHRDWASTYQKVPTIYDKELSNKGAKMIVSRGETNVAAGSIFDDFDSWTEKLWTALGGESNAVTADGLEMEISTNTRASNLRHSVQDAVVLKNKLLTPEGVKPEKRYIEFQLPSDASYETGDYLALLPVNDMEVVSRVLRRFGLPWDATINIKKNAHSTIPTDVELSASSVLASYVELHTAATKKNMQTLANYLSDETRAKIDLNNTTQQSVLDIAEAYPDLNISFSVYLSMLPPMRIRQYSISSSPLANPSIASITFSLASDLDGSHPGVATHYLRKLQPGSIAQISIRKSPAPFHPPSDPTVPLLMVCAGTGLSPFRGFVQDRAIKLASAKNPSEFAPAILIIGSRDPKLDAIHADEFAEWQKAGVVKVYHAYSRASDLSDGCKYAQDRMWREREELCDLFAQGGKVFICGSGRLGKGVNEMASKMSVEWRAAQGRDDADLESCRAWWEGLRNERYAVDVFD